MNIKTLITILSCGLLACFLFSFLGHLHWLPALFMHFYLQMSLIALLLCMCLVKINKNLILASCMATVTIIGYAQTRLPMQNPLQFTAPTAHPDHAILKIAQYNKYHKNKPFDVLPEWIENNQIELLVMQEVTTYDVTQLKNTLKNVLPYTLPPMRRRPGHALVFSKYPLEDLRISRICKTGCHTSGMRFNITLEHGQKVTIYSAHTDTPIKHMHYVYQTKELFYAGEWIAKDKGKNIIFIGDINTTPYSIQFNTFMRLSNLNYQFYGFLPANTWPSFLLIPVLKIPIDHILFSDALTLLNIKRGPSHGSDHHSLIATFAVE